MKIYLAAQYKQRDELKKYAEELNEMGIEVTSRWLQEPPKELGIPTEHERRIQYAIWDKEDVERADVLILFSVSEHEAFLRGGKDVEFGMALAWDKYVIVVGPKQNIFHYLPNRMDHVTNWEAAKDILRNWLGWF